MNSWLAAAEMKVVLAGSGSMTLTLVAGSGPEWSPDDRWIAFETPSGRNVDAISPDGKRRRDLLRLDLNSATNYTVVWCRAGC